MKGLYISTFIIFSSASLHLLLLVNNVFHIMLPMFIQFIYFLQWFFTIISINYSSVFDTMSPVTIIFLLWDYSCWFFINIIFIVKNNFVLAAPAVCGSSRVRNWTCATVAIYATDWAMWDPLTCGTTGEHPVLFIYFNGKILGFFWGSSF